MKILKTTNGYNVLIDDEDYDNLNTRTWYADIRGYVHSTDGKHRLHDVVMGVNPHDLRIKELEVDHIDRNTYNNQKSNLRICTHRQNMINTVRSDTKFRGVSCVYGKWQASIFSHGKRIYIGRYDSRHEAAKAYNDKAVELFGEFAVLNNLEQPVS